MRVLFDQGTPVPLRHVLAGHLVETAYERGWQALNNGELLRVAEEAGFGLLVTTDQNLRHQQNLANRRIAIHVLKTASWPRIRKHANIIAAAVSTLAVGEYRELSLPD